MAYLTTKDYNLEVLQGNVAGHSMVSIQGHNEAQGTTEVTVHPTGDTSDINQSVIFGTPAVVSVASTSDADNGGTATGALTVRIFGLDSSGNAQTADETLNGQTAVTTSETWSAITGIVVLTTGSGNKNAGVLWVGTGVFTAGVPAVRHFSMDIGDNKGLSAYYVVPTGKTLYLRHFTANLATTNKDLELRVQTSLDGIQWTTQARFGMEPGTFTAPVIATPGIPAATCLRVTGDSSGASTDVTIIMACELIDD